MATKILVIGATGTTGQPLLEKLAGTEGVVVRAATRTPGKVVRDRNIEYVPFAYKEVSSIQKALQNVQKVYLVTPFVPELFDFESAVIEQLRHSGVELVVKLSVVGADQDDGTTPVKIHRQLEQLIRDTGVAHTFLRPGFFMQNYANIMSDTILAENAFYLPMGEGKVSVVDTRDVAAVAYKVLTGAGHEGHAYTLTGPEALSNYEIATILSDVLRREIKYVDVSQEQARVGLKAAGLPDWTIDRMLELYQANKDGYAAMVSPDMEKVTGFKPTSFREFAQDYADVFR
jgi:uncharacterized protein YbjT (DUF2867 family)